MYQNTFDTYLIHVPTLLISCPVPVACQQPSVKNCSNQVLLLLPFSR